jgi:hypothetical protein
MLGRAPAIGRDFTMDDDRPGSDPVVILDYAVWRDRYQADPGVIGRTIRVNGVPSTVIGVMPEGFGFPVRSRIWQPLTLMPASVLNDRSRQEPWAHRRTRYVSSFRTALFANFRVGCLSAWWDPLPWVSCSVDS